MAIVNPSSLYGGNANVFNFTPIIQYHQRQEAIKRAKEDAADAYFRDLSKGLTPTGMAPNDIKDFVDKKNLAQNYAIQNRNILRNPRDPRYAATLNEVNYRFNDALEHAERSKAKVQNILPIRKMFTNPQLSELLDDEIRPNLEKASLPVSDPNYTPFDESTIQLKPKPFNTAAWNKEAAEGLKMGDLIESTTTDPNTLKQITTIKSTYSPEDLDIINKKSANKYITDRSARQFVKDIEANPEYHKKLNDVFKATYGVDIQDPSELLTAATLSSIQRERTNQKIADDKAGLEALRQKNKMALEAYKQGGRMALLKKKNQFKKENAAQQGLILEGYIDGLDEEALKGTKHTYTTKEGNTDTRYSMPKTPELMEIFSYKNSDGKTIRPDDIYRLEDGRYQPIFYNKKTESNGDVVPIKSANGVYSVDETRSNPVSRQTLKFNLGKEMLSAKQREAEMLGGNEDETITETPKKTTIKITKDNPAGLRPPKR